MQIKSLTIENFRTFYKKTKIDFSIDSKKIGRNVQFYHARATFVSTLSGIKTRKKTYARTNQFG